MDAIDLGSSTLSANAADDAAQHAKTRRRSPSHAADREHIGGLRWTFRPGFEQTLRAVPADAWRDPAAQGWTRVKHNDRREVWRADLPGGVVYAKYYERRRWNPLDRLRAPGCVAEWNGGMFAQAAGIDAVRPVAFTTDLRRRGRRCSLLLTEAAEPSVALCDFWEQVRRDEDARRRGQDAARLREQLAELIARAHQAGFEHLDMHAANILVQTIAARTYRTLFVDLHSARRGRPISDAAVVRNLAQLNQWFRRHSTVSDRLRFLRSYLRWRNEYETRFALARPMRLSLRGLVTALAGAAERHARRLWAQRDRRLRRSGGYFARLKLPGSWRGMAVLKSKHRLDESRASEMTFERRWWSAQLADPNRLANGTSEPACKISHSARVARALLAHPDGNLPVIVKQPLARNAWRRFVSLFPPSRAQRAWTRGHALLHRDIATARPLAFVERRIGPFVLESVAVSEALPGAMDLEQRLRSAGERGDARRWRRFKDELTARLADALRRLHERGFVHRDCKASNLLVVERGALRLVWIDMDGIRAPSRWGGWAGRREICDSPAALRAIARLHVSLADVPGITRTDRVRFLRSVLARYGARSDAWRIAWDALAPLIDRKTRRAAARREWKQKHYGRA